MGVKFTGFGQSCGPRASRLLWGLGGLVKVRRALSVAGWMIIGGFGISAQARLILQPEAIYEQDSRREYHEIADPRVRALADATVAFIEKKSFRPESVQQEPLESYQLEGKTQQEDFQLCAAQRFASQKTSAFCSGVLIAPDRVLTAGHCVANTACAELRLAFGYALRAKGYDPYQIQTKNIYDCAEVLERGHGQLDYAVVRLDRPVPDRVPVSLAAPSEELVPGAPLLMTGFPAGLPLKVDAGGKVRSVTRELLKAELDAFGGNSGSPVFNLRTLALEGILVEGEEDFDWDEGGQCYRLHRCAAGECSGEKVVRTGAIVDQVTQGL
jgi:hypothetical protein